MESIDGQMIDRFVILWFVALNVELEYFCQINIFSFGFQRDLFKFLLIYLNCDIKSVLDRMMLQCQNIVICCLRLGFDGSIGWIFKNEENVVGKSVCIWQI